MTEIAVGLSIGYGLSYHFIGKRPLPASCAHLIRASRREIAVRAFYAGAIFIGVVLARDSLALFGHERPAGELLSNYVLAIGIGIGQYAVLRRRVLASRSVPGRSFELIRPRGGA
jgi:hypothetical protein